MNKSTARMGLGLLAWACAVFPGAGAWAQADGPARAVL